MVLSSAKFMLERHVIELKKNRVLGKVTILCWVAFIATLHHMQSEGYRLYLCVGLTYLINNDPAGHP